MGKLGLVLMARAMFCKSLIQFSFDGQDFVLSWLFGLRPNYGRGNEGMVNFFRDFVFIPGQVSLAIN